MSIELLDMDLSTSLADGVEIEEFVLNSDGSVRPIDDGGVVEILNVGSREIYSILIATEGCGDQDIYIPIDSNRTIRVTRVFDDSFNFFNITPKEKINNIDGLIYTDNASKWKVTEQIIQSLKLID